MLWKPHLQHPCFYFLFGIVAHSGSGGDAGSDDNDIGGDVDAGSYFGSQCADDGAFSPLPPSLAETVASKGSPAGGYVYI